MSDSNSIEDFLAEVKQEVKQECSSDLNCDWQVTFDWESHVRSCAVVIGEIVPVKQDASVTSQKQAKMQLRSGKLISCNRQSDNIADDSQQLGMKTTSVVTGEMVPEKQDASVTSQKQAKMQLRSGKLISCNRQSDNIAGDSQQLGMKTTSSKSAFCDSVVTGRHDDQRQVVDGELESQVACKAVATTADMESLSDSFLHSSAVCSLLDGERDDNQLQSSALVDAEEDRWSRDVEDHSCFSRFDDDESEHRLDPLNECSLNDLQISTTCEQLKTVVDAEEYHESLPRGVEDNSCFSHFDDDEHEDEEPLSECSLNDLQTSTTCEQLKIVVDAGEDHWSIPHGVEDHSCFSHFDDDECQDKEPLNECSLNELQTTSTTSEQLKTVVDAGGDHESLPHGIEDHSCFSHFDDDECEDKEPLNECSLNDLQISTTCEQLKTVVDAEKYHESLSRGVEDHGCFSHFDDDERKDKEPLNECSLNELQISTTCEQLKTVVDAGEDHWSIPHGVEDHSCFSHFDDDECEDKEPLNECSLNELQTTSTTSEQLKTVVDAEEHHESLSRGVEDHCCFSHFDDDEREDKEPLNECSLNDLQTSTTCEQLKTMVDAGEDHWSIPCGLENHSCFRPFNNSSYDENEDIEPLTEHSLMELCTTNDIAEQLKTSDDALHDCMSLPVDQADQSADTDTQHFQVNFGTHLLINVVHVIINIFSLLGYLWLATCTH